MAFNIKKYLGLERPPVIVNPGLEDLHDDPGLMVTGDDLVQSILENIKLRRSVLVTGPRGCGKSYCSEAAIRLARDHGVIGGWRFLQGNREIPRDTLSEDMLVVGEGGKVELVPALALRPLDGGQARRVDFPDWPGIPTRLRTQTYDPRAEWLPRDWVVLFLDEINRFGDGFLDSLLSLIEEGKIIRRGEEYYVPLIVVATANPPGYDVTAKKLSPPLQARITRSFRVSQPDTTDIVEKIMPGKIADFAASYPEGSAPAVPLELRYLAAGATLALWGDPRAGSKGRFFLTRTSKQRLERVMAVDPELANAMSEFSALIEFGPDARAVTDWIGCAMALAARQEMVHLEPKHLLATAVHVLGHKVREKFNEGANPDLAIRKDVLLGRIVGAVLGTPSLASTFGLSTAPTSRPATAAQEVLTERQFKALAKDFQAIQPFMPLLLRGYPAFVATVLPTREHVLLWLNTLDACLGPHATPDYVSETVQTGFWNLARAVGRNAISPEIVGNVGELLAKSFAAIHVHSNPAGQERAKAASENLHWIRAAALSSPSVVGNAPAASGVRARPTEW